MNQKSNMIKDIFFDIGNVLIDIHPEDCIQYWADSADLTKGEIIKAFSNDLHNAYEIGKITNNDFFYSFKNALPQPCCLKKSDFWRGWNKLLGKEKHTVEILKLLSLDYNIWLLSNTNPKHINNNLKLSSTFFEFVKGAIYSFEVGVRKPDPTIFENALKLSGSGSSKTLFIDDLIENIQIAKKLGWKAIHYENDNLLQDQLTFLGIDTLASN
jgi:FMN phosphatase YigB (HAD superfamily)|tara:strand:+ start:574 stop:1212 length:639 start_codon:yes stop_codon:yes gene_type:complete